MQLTNKTYNDLGIKQSQIFPKSRTALIHSLNFVLVFPKFSLMIFEFSL